MNCSSRGGAKWRAQRAEGWNGALLGFCRRNGGSTAARGCGFVCFSRSPLRWRSSGAGRGRNKRQSRGYRRAGNCRGPQRRAHRLRRPGRRLRRAAGRRTLAGGCRTGGGGRGFRPWSARSVFPDLAGGRLEICWRVVGLLTRAASGRSVRPNQNVPELQGNVLVYRTGMRFLLLHAQVGQHFEDNAGFHLKLPSQLVDSDLLHRKDNFCHLLIARSAIPGDCPVARRPRMRRSAGFLTPSNTAFWPIIPRFSWYQIRPSRCLHRFRRVREGSKERPTAPQPGPGRALRRRH